MNPDTTDLALKEDEMNLTKQDVEDMIDGLIKRSKRNSDAAKKRGEKKTPWAAMYRSSLRGFKGVLTFTPEKAVVMVWSDILRFFNLLIIRNTMEKEKGVLGNKSPLQRTFSKLVQDMKEGNW